MKHKQIYYGNVQTERAAPHKFCCEGSRGGGGKRETEQSPPFNVDVKEYVELYLHSPILFRRVVSDCRDKFILVTHGLLLKFNK
jgi:hypothetical protein